MERLARDKRSSLIGLFVSEDGKKFYTFDTSANSIKLFKAAITNVSKKTRVFVASFPSLV